MGENVATLALGSRPRQRVTGLWAKREAQESCHMLPGVQESVREWTLTLPRELPLWELEYEWTPKCPKINFRVQNPMDWRFFYIIGKLLKHRCQKWARMTHLDIWNTSYGQKKDQKSKGQFDSRPLKVRNRPNLFRCMWLATYHWKAVDKGYNFALELISIWGLHAKLWAPKVAGVPTVGILGLPFGSPETKCHLDVGLVERHIVYYKGGGGGFPQVQAVVSLMSPSCLWFDLAPNVLQLCTNHFVLVLCRFMWVVNAFHSS